MAERVFIGLGSNIGSHYSNCTRSILEILGDKRARLESLSSLYYTSPLSTIPQPDILNGVFTITWEDSATELLSLVKEVEKRMGRFRTIRNGPRIIDLDILLFGQTVVRLPDLIVPHPRLHERKFVLVPCLEIDPLIVHPVLHTRFDELLNSIEEEQRVSWFCSVREEDVLPVYSESHCATGTQDRTKGS